LQTVNVTRQGRLQTSVKVIRSNSRLCELQEKPEQQIPRELNFTPTGAKTVFVGDPGSPARDDKN
jgi:hypothetical protein